MFDYENFGAFECPVISVSLASEGSPVQVANLLDPI